MSTIRNVTKYSACVDCSEEFGCPTIVAGSRALHAPWPRGDTPDLLGSL